MIKLENVVLASPEQMEFIIEGMRNPMNSWEKSDSDFETAGYDIVGFNVGENDHSLMQRLANAGTDHRKFMRMMPVYVRITAPLYWWKEFDTYKVGTVANSCSTMRKIAEKEFAWEDFSNEQLLNFGGVVSEDFLRRDEASYCPAKTFGLTIRALNGMRERYLDYKSRGPEWANNAKQAWWQMIQLLPSSYNQTRNVMLNYEVLANIYKSRKDHKLDEWRVHETPEEHKFRNKDFASGMWGFCDWIESLPYSELITKPSIKTDINTDIIDAMNTIRKED